MIILGLVLLLASLGVACQETGPASTEDPQAAASTPTASPTAPATPIPMPTPTGTPIPISAREIMQSSVSGMQEIESLHYEMVTKFNLETQAGAVNIPVTLVGDYQAPDRSEAAMSASIVFLTFESRIIIIGETAYFTDFATGEWGVLAGEAPFFADAVGFITAKVSEITDLAVVGEESLDGERVYHLTGTAPPGTFDESVGEFRAGFWIGIEDFLLRQVAAEGEIELDEEATAFLGGVAAGNATVSLSLWISDFGKTVSIEAPDVTPAPSSR